MIFNEILNGNIIGLIFVFSFYLHSKIFKVSRLDKSKKMLGILAVVTLCLISFLLFLYITNPTHRNESISGCIITFYSIVAVYWFEIRPIINSYDAKRSNRQKKRF
jgi:hypothetical protein